MEPNERQYQAFAEGAAEMPAVRPPCDYGDHCTALATHRVMHECCGVSYAVCFYHSLRTRDRLATRPIWCRHCAKKAVMRFENIEAAVRS